MGESHLISYPSFELEGADESREGIAEYQPISRYEELRVFQSAYSLALRIFEITKDFPSEERYDLTIQMRRASRSVCANISEAWGKRRYPQHFVSKLSDSYAEGLETEMWLRFARDFGYISEELFGSMFAAYEQVCGSLVKMMSQPRKWCGPKLSKEDHSK